MLAVPRLLWSAPLLARSVKTKGSLITADHRPPLLCRYYPFVGTDRKLDFDLSKVVVEMGGPRHAELIRSFLYEHFWPRETATVTLYVPLQSPLLSVLTEKYSNTGDRYMAFEKHPRTNEHRLIGVLVADKIFPWTPDELERWAHHSSLEAEANYLNFQAFCIRDSKMFDRHHAPYSYHIGVLATSSDVMGQGVGYLLNRIAVMRGLELRHPVITALSTNNYMHTICRNTGMINDWTSPYKRFTNEFGQYIFYVRPPHYDCRIFSRKVDEAEGSVPDRCDSPALHEVFQREALHKKPVEVHKKTCDMTNMLKFPDLENRFK